jgi:hypothetical protein
MLILAAIPLMQCEKVVDIDLNTMEPKLVIDASIDWERGTTGSTQTIKLTTTSGYYDSEVPVVSGAIVAVTNSTGKAFDFIEVPGTGQYTCTDFEPVGGALYTLVIQYNGQRYTSSETLVMGAGLEDNIDQDNAGGFGGDEIEIKYYFRDNASEVNFYLTSIQAPFSKYPAYTVDSDQFTQGNQMFQTYSHADLAKGDFLAIRLYGISKRYYDYMIRLLEATGKGAMGDGPFTTIPAAVKGNIVNETNKANYALGYFRLSEVVTRDYTVQ